MDRDTLNEVEILEVGRAMPRRQRPGGAIRHRSTHRRLLPDIVVVSALAVAVVIAIAHGQLSQPDANSAAKPSQPQPHPGEEIRVGALPAASGDWILLGLSGRSEVRVDLAGGSVSDSTVGGNDERPRLLGETGVSGDTVMADNAIVPLGGAASTSPVVLLGPERDDVWVAGPGHQMRLVRLDGRPAGISIKVPRQVPLSAVRPDGAGYLLVTSTGGTYATRPGIRRLVTHGQLLAIGPTGWLTRECSTGACRLVLVQREDGARQVLNIPVPQAFGIGLIAPDGNDVALHSHSRSGAPVVLTVGLLNGRMTRVVAAVPTAAQGEDPGAWSPDGRYLFVSEAGGGVAVQDTERGTTMQLGRFAPPLVATAIRLAGQTPVQSGQDPQCEVMAVDDWFSAGATTRSAFCRSS